MWVIPPLLPGASRADREWHRREVAVTERELKDVWTNVCLVTHLAQVIPPPGAILQAPKIATITLDSVPARFSVRLRPGQLPIDFVERAERLAAAFRVPAVEVVTLTRDQQWISIRLMEPYWIEWPDEYVVEAAAEEPAPAVAGDDRVPVGGPPRLEHGRHRAADPVGGDAESSEDPGPTSPFGAVLRFLGDFWRLPEPPAAQ